MIITIIMMITLPSVRGHEYSQSEDHHDDSHHLDDHHHHDDHDHHHHYHHDHHHFALGPRAQVQRKCSSREGGVRDLVTC